MSIPEHLWRFPERKAIDSLAQRFNLSNTPDMQDWEWQVADPERIDEFIYAYLSEELSDDEKFILMEIILQSFADSDLTLEGNIKWELTLRLIEENLKRHAFTIWYWGDFEENEEPDRQDVDPYIKSLFLKYRQRLMGDPVS
ncbi:MAG: hypothetical protein GY777_30575 [Candidatus Brocadiaceae bacterium]|nr:hypothetical protein [Candidatus Brocadiaceae bacterium]